MKKRILALIAVSLIGFAAFSQEHEGEINRQLPSFSRVTASPHINVVLTEGEEESVRLVYRRVEPGKINVEVKGKTLQIYLEDSRFTEKMVRVNAHEKRNYYMDASVTAYITYRKLEGLEIRGEQEATCKSPIRSKKFVVKAYGRNEINLVSLNTGYLKTRLYGENRLRIAGGKAEFQRYRLYGENEIDTEDLNSYHANAMIFGESKLRLSTQDEFVIHAFGESRVALAGNAVVNKGLVFGRTDIRRID